MNVKANVLVAMEPNPEAAHIWHSAAQFSKQAWPDADRNMKGLSIVPPIVEAYADLNFAPLARHTTTWSKEIKEAHAAELQRRLASSETPFDPTSQMTVIEGYPAACISEAAAEYDLVVMGLHNRSGFRKMLGSTTHSVLNQCDKDLLAVHPNSTHPQGYNSLLICVDASDTGRTILEQMVELITSVKNYKILTAIPPVNSIYANVYGDFGLGSSYNAVSEELAKHCTEVVKSTAAETGLDPDKVETIHGDPVNTICDQAAETDADLIVMGANQRSALNRLLLGSTCRGVLQSAPSDVLILRCS